MNSYAKRQATWTHEIIENELLKNLIVVAHTCTFDDNNKQEDEFKEDYLHVTM